MLIRYVGPYNGTVKGTGTGHKYAMKKAKREPFYADVRDIPGLMQMRDGDDQLMFEKGD